MSLGAKKCCTGFMANITSLPGELLIAKVSAFLGVVCMYIMIDSAMLCCCMWLHEAVCQLICNPQ